MLLVMLVVSFFASLLYAGVILIYPGRRYFSKRHYFSGFVVGFLTLVPFYIKYRTDADLGVYCIIVPGMIAVIANMPYVVTREKADRLNPPVDETPEE